MYPVLYMHDGQNVFSPGGEFGCWFAEITADDLIRRRVIPPLIIVAIDNDGFNRRSEYVPPGDRYRDWPETGKADRYARYVTGDVAPLINRTYRTLTGPAATSIAGSSLGGVVSLYMAMNSEIFGMAASMSTAICWATGFLQNLSTAKKKQIRIYHDIGTAESEGMAPDDYWDMPHQLQQALLRAGYQPETELKFVVEPHASHHESAWARRLPDMLTWMYRTTHDERT